MPNSEFSESDYYMNQRKKTSSLNFSFVDRKVLLLIFAIIFYLSFFFPSFLSGDLLKHMSVDYPGYWSVGKIADEQGYSKIYDPKLLDQVQKSVYLHLKEINSPVADYIGPVPVPYFSVFMIPFQFLSRFPPENTVWLWNFINLLSFAFYLIYFIRQTSTEQGISRDNLTLVIFLLFSWAVIINTLSGQVGAFMCICTGEFIRNAFRHKPILSGLWLGGLLIKPQTLILILPFLLLNRDWNALKGFGLSAFVILSISYGLSGLNGMRDLFNLLIRYSAGMETNAVEAMVNWRMIGLLINTYFQTNFGWVATAAGTVLTLIPIWYLSKQKTEFGSPRWVLSVFGVFLATCLVTWHSHYHMMMLLIPLFIYTVQHKLLPEKYLIWWVVITPLTIITSYLLDIYTPIVQNFFQDNYLSVLAISGLLVNLIILFRIAPIVVPRTGAQVQLNNDD